jgi:PAS domain S-box-containing protein
MENTLTEEGGADLDRLMSALSDAIIVSDRRGTITALNSAAERLLGRPSVRVVGSGPPYIFWPEDQISPIVEMLGRTLSPGTQAPHGFDTSYVHVSGKLVPVRLNVRPWGTSLLQIASPRLEGSQLPSSDLLTNRICTLEQGLRNIAWELRALGAGVSGSAGPSAVPAQTIRELSNRQREVLDAFLGGHSVANTASRLHLSEHTVRSHLKVIYRKMGVRSGTELMRRLAAAPADPGRSE